jgi:putative ABC transport system permease protein
MARGAPPMRHYKLIWSGIWRNQTRTAYTLLSIFVAFVLFGLLQGVTAAFNGAVARARLDRLYVDSRFGLVKGLPLAYMERIARLGGITTVTHATWFGGSYQETKQPVFSLAVDPEPYLAIYTELELPHEQAQKMARTRDGVIVSRKIAERFNWKIGDRIPLRSSVWSQKGGSSVWTFEVVGIFDTPEDRRTRTELLLNYAYLDEGRSFSNGSVGWYIAKIADSARSSELAAAIDALFANSSDETLTQNEQEKAQALLKQHGDISLIVNLIMGAVFFTLLLLTGNTMMQSVRERVPEFAVLKTLGYSSATISMLVLFEALLICLSAGAFGLLIAWFLFPVLRVLTQAPRMPMEVLAGGLLVTVLLAAVIALPSTLRLRRINVVDALAGR